MRAFRLMLLLFALLVSAPVLAQDGGATVTPRVIVMPLENRAASRSQGPLSFGLPAMLAERLEADPGIIVINGPLVLTPEQAQLVSQTGTAFDLAAANRLALARGATHFVTGHYAGQVWQWTYVVDVYRADAAGPVLVGSGTANGDLTVAVTLRSGRIAHVQSAAHIHGLFASAVTDAFSAAGMPLAPQTSAAIGVPSTNDSYAFLLLSRAYARYFGTMVSPEPVSSEDTALGIAEHAVLVDPTFVEAQRFYAHLLHEGDRNVSARIHFEAALARRGTDVRTLIELGEIEVGEHNPDVARDYLQRAVAARPQHAVAHYWLGRAFLDLDDKPHATSEFERSRSIDGARLDARRELVRLYADARRYADAATELQEIVRQDPADKDAAFLLAACLRAAGNRDGAIASYEASAARFPDEPRFQTFRGDLLMEAGRNDDAMAAYRAARRLAPRDPRLAAILDGTAPASGELLGGGALVRAIATGVDRTAKMTDARSVYTLSLNDAVLDLQINGPEACRDGRGASSALLARQQGERYWSLGQEMTGLSSGIRTALQHGEGAALTPDEARNADLVLAGMHAGERDVREMRSLFQTTFVPLYRRHACETFDGELHAATIDAVRAHYADRRVTLPEVRPPQWSIPIAPVVPPSSARSITFRVNNAEGRTAYVLWLDGAELGEVAAGRSATFSSRLGPHRICLVPRGTVCGEPGTERMVFLHERWTIRVRPGSTL